MSTVTFSIPDEILRAALTAAIRLAASVKLFEIGQLSSDGAAQLAGARKPYFLSRLAEFGVNTFDLTEEDVARDLTNA